MLGTRGSGGGRGGRGGDSDSGGCCGRGGGCLKVVIVVLSKGVWPCCKVKSDLVCLVSMGLKGWVVGKVTVEAMLGTRGSGGGRGGRGGDSDSGGCCGRGGGCLKGGDFQGGLALL
jgi:hypothetical protein